MMQSNEVQKRVSQIKQTIQLASQACDSAGDSVPGHIKSSIEQLGQRSDQAAKTLQQSSDEASIRQCVDELEQLGDQAKTACEGASNVDQKVKDAVIKAHQELSQLKHQVH
jgi:predicted  nucleic acid-binding Zn-ribbon protein